MIGRKAELQIVSDLLDGASQGSGGSVVFSGEAGIGKTELLGEIAKSARDRGFSVRQVVSTPAQSQLPYAALQTILLPDILEQLDPVLAVVTGHRSSESPPFILAVASALITHLSLVADVKPLLVTIDDFQWIDPSSAAVLALSAGRLLADRVAIVFTYRSHDPSPVIGRSPFDMIKNGFSRPEFPGVASHVITPLGIVESEELLGTLGINHKRAFELAPSVGGSPLALTEVARRDLDGDNRSPLSVPTTYAGRLAMLTFEARRLCAVVAIDEETPLLTGLFKEAALQETLAAGLLRRTPTGVALTHPLLRSAVLNTLSPTEVRSLHGEIARTIASVREDPLNDDRYALHMAESMSGTDEDAAALMIKFAARAQARGALAESTRALFRAAELTTDHQQRIRLMLRGAENLYQSGDAPGGIVAAERVRDLTTDPELIDEAEMVIASAAEWERDPGVTTQDLVRIADRLADAQPSVASAALAQASAMAFLAGDINGGVLMGRRAHKLAEDEQDVIAMFVAQAHIGWNLFLAGKRVEADEELDAVEPLFESLATAADSIEGLLVAQRLTMIRVMKGDWIGAESIVVHAQSKARRMGIRLSAALFSMIRGALLWRVGRWEEAYSLAIDEIAADQLPAISLAWGSAAAAQVTASMGRVQDTERFTSTAFDISARLHLDLPAAWAHAASGHLQLASGHPERALAHFDRVVALVQTIGLCEPGFFLWQGDYLETLIKLGRREEALSALDDLRIVAKDSGRRWAYGIVARTAAMLDDVHDVGAEGFEVAIACFTEIGMPFEVARTFFARGRYAKTDPTQALADLSNAEGRFVRLGAIAWAEQAQASMKSIPTSRERLLDVLTTAEMRVALCIADGRSNKDAAAELHVSPRTIEFHLASIFRKLNVKSRAECIVKLGKMLSI